MTVVSYNTECEDRLRRCGQEVIEFVGADEDLSVGGHPAKVAMTQEEFPGQQGLRFISRIFKDSLRFKCPKRGS